MILQHRHKLHVYFFPWFDGPYMYLPVKMLDTNCLPMFLEYQFVGSVEGVGFLRQKMSGQAH